MSTGSAKMQQAKGVVARSAVVGLALAAIASPLTAQDTFSLPPGTASPTSRPAGPVDPDNPVVVARPRPTPTATAQPSPSASPTPAIPVPPATASTRPAARPNPTAAPRTETPTPAAGTASAPPTSAGDPLTLPGASAPAPTGAAFPTAVPTAPVASPAADAAATSNPALPGWWPIAVGMLALLLVLLGGLVWWRRRPSAPDAAIEFEQPVVERAAPATVPTPAYAPPAESAPAMPKPAAADGAALVSEGLGISLEARRLDASLMATTLAYTLRLTNHGKTPLAALAIEGDMIAAHASLPVEKQIASTELRLELRHTLVELAPGESADFRGEMRLPLASITPIRAGNAAYFVPLIRLRIEAAQSPDEQLVMAQTFVIGELPEQAGGALRPFRLDLGPRTYSKLGQRAVG